MSVGPKTPPTKRAAKAAAAKPPVGRRAAARAGVARKPEPSAAPTSRREASATRERILAAAEEAFAAHGLRGARVQEIVASAGVNERMLYHHFGDKDGLYHAVLLRFFTSIAAEVEAALDAAGSDPVERLRDILRSYFDAMVTHPNVVRVFVHEALAGWPSRAQIMEMRREIDQRLTHRIFAFFTEAARAGVFREGLDPRMALLAAAGACLLVPLALPRVQQFLAADLGNPAELSVVRDALIDTVLQGIVAGPHR